jgi:hypothetical protein
MGYQFIFKKFDLAQLAEGYCFFACGHPCPLIPQKADIQPPSPHVRTLESRSAH